MTVIINTVYGPCGGSDVTDYLEYSLPITEEDISILQGYIDKTLARPPKPPKNDSNPFDWSDWGYNYYEIFTKCYELINQVKE